MNGHAIPTNQISLRNELLEIKEENLAEETFGQIVATKNEPKTIKQEPNVALRIDQTVDSASLPESNPEIEHLQRKLSSLTEEKEKLISELVQSKSEYQRVYFDLKKQMETITQRDQKEKGLMDRVLFLEQERSSLNSLLRDKDDIIGQLKAELRELDEECKLKVSKYEKDLKECNDKISHRLKEKKGCIGESRADSELFNVEAILAHKIVNGKKFFLVRWEGYSAEDDTWEPEHIVKKLSVFKIYVKANSL